MLAHQGYFTCHFEPGSARNLHVLRVRSGFSALSVFKLSATIMPGGPGSYSK
ncbi:L-asparaginase [Citrobacter amalonaticus]|uniref:L-asparaginase n=1 Tax=Citrobacter amalonaticus TaxID=35703 RepID=A0A2S4S4H1_CITAM|nr:L-asparaginase [Citrobacter amalonaticus]POT78363.1 L-asparaginase [Citrobacter amalonaticus]POU68753.1 L-asparaginase [Citrobacter amalonaticus]POV08358.1 L-asparaginase [Citrobacter amalonaticus]